jgi:hypothetical protein
MFGQIVFEKVMILWSIFPVRPRADKTFFARCANTVLQKFFFLFNTPPQTQETRPKICATSPYDGHNSGGPKQGTKSRKNRGVLVTAEPVANVHNRLASKAWEAYL